MVILLTHEYAPFKGGVAVYCQEVNEAASRLGLPFCVWAPKKATGKNVTRLPCGSTLSPWDILSMARALLRKSKDLENNDLILCSYGAHLAAMIAVTLGGLRNCRIASLLHGSEIPRFERNFFWKFCTRPLYRKVTTVFCNSRHTLACFKKSSLYTLSPFHIAEAPCAASTPATRKVEAPTSPDNSNIRILTLARIHPRKGQLDIATALGFLPEEIRSRITYVIGGKGDANYLETIVQRCVRNGIRFEYLGPIADEDLAATYASCDLFAMTSHTLRDSVEGFGISFIEAGWHGKPSVAYNTGGVSEAILDGETGILVKESDTEALAAAFQKIIEDPSLRTRLGKAAREHSHRFDWEHTATTVAQTLDLP